MPSVSTSLSQRAARADTTGCDEAGPVRLRFAWASSSVHPSRVGIIRSPSSFGKRLPPLASVGRSHAAGVAVVGHSEYCAIVSMAAVSRYASASVYADSTVPGSRSNADAPESRTTDSAVYDRGALRPIAPRTRKAHAWAVPQTPARLAGRGTAGLRSIRSIAFESRVSTAAMKSGPSGEVSAVAFVGSITCSIGRSARAAAAASAFDTDAASAPAGSVSLPAPMPLPSIMLEALGFGRVA
mmetsp:Transcript_6510/g.19300  ORF Transcript_6510/g.19300 Transcript_6510/m.19300 type:complete len:241 (+) Transcript_6510:362-1084(+)